MQGEIKCNMNSVIMVSVMTPQPNPSESSLTKFNRRLVYTVLKPAVRLARMLRLPLGVVEELCRMAYFEEVRIRSRASQAETATLMGKSLRTIGSLERKFRGDFLAPERELGLARELEATLSQTPLTLDDIQQSVPHLERDDITRILESLVIVGRVTASDPDHAATRYTLNPQFVSLVEDDVSAKLDGLLHQLDVILEAIKSRFFNTSKHPARARTLTFSADPKSMEALGDDLILELRKRCIEAEELALKNNINDQYAVTFVLTPISKTPDET